MVKVKKPVPIAPTKAKPAKKSIKKNVEKEKSVSLIAKQKQQEKAKPLKQTKSIPPSEAPKKAKATNAKIKTKAVVKLENGEKMQKPKATKKITITAGLISAKAAKGAKNKLKKNKVIKQAANEEPIEAAALIEDAEPFNEAQFKAIETKENIAKIAASLKIQAEQEVSLKKSALFTDYHYNLNVACFKIPDCPKRMAKLNLKHSVVSNDDDDVLIVVPDLQRGAKVDYEPTIQHYTDLFQEHGVNESGWRLTIMPFNQLRQEYKTFESLRKLAATYDYFLSDGRIVGHVVGFVGKIFQKPRTTFHAVHLDKNEKLKDSVERAMLRTAYKQLHRGDLISIPVGNHCFSAEQLAENVSVVLEQLKTIYPGGWANIRNMHLKIDIVGTSSLPIFLSNCKPPAKTPYVVGPREKRMLKLKHEANKVLVNFNLDKKADMTKLGKREAEQKQRIIALRKSLLAEEMAKDEAAKDECEDGAKPAKISKVAEKKVKSSKVKKEVTKSSELLI